MRPAPFALTLAAATALTAPASAQVIYTITDLGSFGGSSNGQAVNAAGQVTGSSYYPNLPNGSPGPVHAFRTTPNGRISDPGADLGTLPGGDTQSFGLGINAAGQVTGVSLTVIGSATTSHGFRTTATGRVSYPGTDLGAISGSPGISFGRAINATGQVAGDSTTAAGNTRAFRSSPNGQPVLLTDLGAFPGGNNSIGYGINDAGQVTGYSEYSPGPSPGTFGPYRAFQTTAMGVLTDPGADLGTLGGTRSQENAINSSGQVTGMSFTAFDLAQHAFRSSPNGQPVSITDLGTLGGTNSYGYAINTFGVVVGYSDMPGGGGNIHAFIYDAQMRDLNSLIAPGSGWLLGTALGINDLGQITGGARSTGKVMLFC
jgi:probable HAF family extracellular repeat protein